MARSRTRFATKNAQKLFNMQSINDAIDQVIAELNKWASKTPELQEAVEELLDAKELIISYSDRLLNNPSGTVDPYGMESASVASLNRFNRRTSKGNYDSFEDNYGFDTPSSILGKQRDTVREDYIRKEDRRIEQETDRRYNERTGGTGGGLCRDDEGQFEDC